jgi:hypothetical protein
MTRLPRLPRLLTFLLVVCATRAFADTSDGWAVWSRNLKQMCPGRRVEWVEDGGYLDLLYAFEATLPEKMRDLVRRTGDINSRCSDEKIGFSCEMSVSLETYKRLGLMRRFVAFGCREVRCEEPALCSKFPRPSTR